MRFKKNSFIVFVIIAILLLMQFFINRNNDKLLPKIGITPEVPTIHSTKFMALGDDQFYFRMLAIYLQNAGDTFGRFTALKNYDYQALLKWFLLLDELDNRSNFVPSLAAYYYSNTQNVKDNKYIIEYLEHNYDSNPPKKWWWLAQASLISSYKLKDKNLALRLAFKLSNTNERIPKWAQQLPAIIYAEMGENYLALQVMKDLVDKHDDYNKFDLNYIDHFVKERLGFEKENIVPKL